jgi:Family of unknown function (DUF5923)
MPWPFGRSKRRSDTEPLLAQYHENTSLQAKAHGKLHTYQMLRALSKGYFPTTEQTIIHLRTLLSSDLLHPTNTQLSPDGRALVRNTRKLIEQFIETLRAKNGEDQIQELLYCIKRARVSIDAADLIGRAGRARVGADTRAGKSNCKLESNIGQN